MIVVPKPGECPEDYIRRAGRIAERLGLGGCDQTWVRMVREPLPSRGRACAKPCLPISGPRRRGRCRPREGLLSATKLIVLTKHPRSRSVARVRSEASGSWRAETLPFPGLGVRLLPQHEPAGS